MKLQFHFVLLSTLLLFSMPGYSQYYFKRYQVDDGLVHNSVTSVIQDNKGLIWIGTRGGLSRFDGYTFKTYQNRTNKFGSLGNNVITSIVEDKNGLLWIGTGKGIFSYNPYQENFDELEEFPQHYISNLAVDAQNRLWFLANHTLRSMDPKNREITNHSIRASCFSLDSSGQILIGHDDGSITEYFPSSKDTKKVQIVPLSIPETQRSISKILRMDQENLLIGCFNQGLKSYNERTGKVNNVLLTRSHNTDIYVRDIAKGNEAQYWIASESGIFIYDLTTNSSTHLQKKTGDPYSITDNAVYTVFKDNSEGIWVGTYFGGLNYYSEQNARFEKYYALPGSNSISGDAVAEIVPDDKGNIWIGTEDAGINKLNLSNGQFTNYTATGKPGDVSYRNIHGMFARGNRLYVGPFFNGLEIMDTRTGNITDRFQYIGAKNDQVSNFVSKIYLTKDSTMLIGTAYRGSGLFIFDPSRKTFNRIPQIPKDSYVFAIHEDHRGFIWTGSVRGGAYYYHPKTGEKGNIRFGDKENNRMNNEFSVHSIHEDGDHNLWFATAGGGIVKLSADRTMQERISTEQGLPSNVVFSILEDDDKNLWISSLKGLVKYSLTSQRIDVYNKSNGLITDQFNYGSAYKAPDGTLYFGSVKGLIRFDPKKFDREEVSPPTYITGFQINNTEITPYSDRSPISKSITYTDTIILAHDQNNFSIEFAALNYASPEVTRYKYRMTGIDLSWTYLNENRKAYFTDLNPGSYEFIVQAESNIGSWVGAEKRLLIKVMPPFWKSSTAYFLYGLAIVLATFFSIRSYNNYIVRKQDRKMKLFELQKEKEIYQAKIEFFTNITHEIQTPLTLIAGPIEWLLKKFDQQPDVKKSLKLAEKNANRLVELTHQLLDFRKTEADQFSLNFVETDINALLLDTVGSFKAQALKQNVSLSVDLPNSPVTAYVDRDALIKICGNLISNAIKYGLSFVSIHLGTPPAKDNSFSIQVVNDGKSIPSDARQRIFEPFFRVGGSETPGTGIGLSIARSLAELHNGSLELLPGKSGEITFELILPIHQKFEFQLSSWKKLT